MALFGLPGINYTHPERMFPFAVDVTNLSGYNATSLVNSSVSTYISVLDQNGAALDSSFTGGVSKQIVSLSGKGEVLFVVGPVTATGSETTQFTFVLDGVTYTSPAFTPGVASARLGLVTTPVYNGTLFTTVGAGHFSGQLDSSKKMLGGNAAGAMITPSWLSPVANSVPKLEFKSSCVISITHSVTVTSVTSQNRLSGVVYRMLPTWS